LRAPTLAPSVRKSAPAPVTEFIAPAVERAAVRNETSPIAPRVEEPVSSFTAPLAPAAAAGNHDWHDISAQLRLVGMARQLAHHCELAGIDQHSITLRLPPLHKHLLSPPAQAKLQSELERHFGRSLRLSIQLEHAAGETPVARSNNIKRERQERAIAAIEEDPFVREVVELFDATINESSIKPLENQSGNAQ
jgi:DNA polymerase-3 subunit gamma/tau